MEELEIHADRRLAVRVQGTQLPWVASPVAGVERRMLERIGGEVALATSIVRYAPGRGFHSHAHALGEEFVVLEGVFSDEHGDYPAGTYVHNPPGSSHAPRSREGCVIFVKLRQMPADETRNLVLRPEERRWATSRYEGLARAPLLAGNGVDVCLERLPPGYHRKGVFRAGGEEIFVLEGAIEMLDAQRTAYGPWGWLRTPGDFNPGFASNGGALLWVKRGHLP